MTKKQAIAIITKCAKQYQQHLEGKQVAIKDIAPSLLEDPETLL